MISKRETDDKRVRQIGHRREKQRTSERDTEYIRVGHRKHQRDT